MPFRVFARFEALPKELEVPPPAPVRPIPATPLEPREQPAFFHTGDDALYGVYHPAATSQATTVVVHCHGLGVEQVVNYRNAVRLARALAARGVPAFRWHARGHGDSTGDFADVTLDRLADDAIAAMDEARARSGATRVAFVAERFGALVAASALARRDDVAALALWEPVHRPDEYFRGMLRGLLFSEVARGRRPGVTVDELLDRVAREGAVDVHGYHLHRAVVESTRGADLASRLAGWNGPTLLVQVQARPRLAPAHAALVAELERRGARVATRQIAEEPGWHFISNPAWESDALVDETAEWLRAVA